MRLVATDAKRKMFQAVTWLVPAVRPLGATVGASCQWLCPLCVLQLPPLWPPWSQHEGGGAYEPTLLRKAVSPKEVGGRYVLSGPGGQDRPRAPP